MDPNAYINSSHPSNPSIPFLNDDGTVQYGSLDIDAFNPVYNNNNDPKEDILDYFTIEDNEMINGYDNPMINPQPTPNFAISNQPPQVTTSNGNIENTTNNFNGNFYNPPQQYQQLNYYNTQQQTNFNGNNNYSFVATQPQQSQQHQQIQQQVNNNNNNNSPLSENDIKYLESILKKLTQQNNVNNNSWPAQQQLPQQQPNFFPNNNNNNTYVSPQQQIQQPSNNQNDNMSYELMTNLLKLAIEGGFIPPQSLQQQQMNTTNNIDNNSYSQVNQSAMSAPNVTYNHQQENLHYYPHQQQQLTTPQQQSISNIDNTLSQVLDRSLNIRNSPSLQTQQYNNNNFSRSPTNFDTFVNNNNVNNSQVIQPNNNSLLNLMQDQNVHSGSTQPTLTNGGYSMDSMSSNNSNNYYPVNKNQQYFSTSNNNNYNNNNLPSSIQIPQKQQQVVSNSSNMSTGSKTPIDVFSTSSNPSHNTNNSYNKQTTTFIMENMNIQNTNSINQNQNNNNNMAMQVPTKAKRNTWTEFVAKNLHAINEDQQKKGRVDPNVGSSSNNAGLHLISSTNIPVNDDSSLLKRTNSKKRSNSAGPTGRRKKDWEITVIEQRDNTVEPISPGGSSQSCASEASGKSDASTHSTSGRRRSSSSERKSIEKQRKVKNTLTRRHSAGSSVATLENSNKSRKEMNSSDSCLLPSTGAGGSSSSMSTNLGLGLDGVNLNGFYDQFPPTPTTPEVSSPVEENRKKKKKGIKFFYMFEQLANGFLGKKSTKK